MSKRKFYMHKHYLSMMRITPSSDAEGRHSEGKKPYSRGKITYKQMEDLDFKDLARSGGGKNPCSGHKSLAGGFIPLSINCSDGIQEVGLEISSDFLVPAMVADSDGLSFTNGKPVDKDTLVGLDSTNTLMTFDPASFAGDGIEVICVDVHDAECGGTSTFCMFIVGCGDCSGADCGAGLAVSGADSIAVSTTEQYTLDNAQGAVTWAVSGEVGSSGSIDSDGLLTVDSVANGACGTLTITATDSCCGDYTKDIRVTGTGAGFWGDQYETWNTLGACGCPGSCQEILDALQYSFCTTSICEADFLENACVTSVSNVCGCSGATPYIYTTLIRIDKWLCFP